MVDILQLEGVKTVGYRAEDDQIIVTVEHDEEPLQSCPDCGGQLYKHGNRTNTFADAPLHMQPTKLEVIRPRYRCKGCKKLVTPELVFLDEKRRATKRLVQQVRKRCLDRTFTQIADDTGVTLNTIKNITLDFIEELERDVKFETPTIMGIDELKLAGEYRCVVTNIGMSTLYDMLPNRTQKTLIPYFAALPDPEKVEWVCTDMWRPFKRSFQPYLPNATLVIDKFHVVRMANNALEIERKSLQSLMTRQERVRMKKHVRWLFLRRYSTLDAEQLESLHEVATLHPELKLAYDIKEDFFDIYEARNKSEAIKRFHDWERNLPSGSKSFRDVAKTVNNHFEDIFAYWDSPARITNAYTEGNNALTRVANRMGRGYTFDVIRAKMLYNKIARSISTINTQPSRTGWGWVSISKKTEYGPHIPTLADIFEEEP